MKSIWKSKTVWVNGIMALLAILTMVNPEMLTSFGLGANAEKEILTIVGLITAIANVFLRMVTTEPITLKKPTDATNPPA